MKLNWKPGRVLAVTAAGVGLLCAGLAAAGTPLITIRSPVAGGQYRIGKPISARYSCKEHLPAHVTSCSGTAANGASFTPTVAGLNQVFTVSSADDQGGHATATVTFNVYYPFQGFFSPVTNTTDHKLNQVHAGNLIRIGFTLGGDYGGNILAAGYPQVTDLASCPAQPTHVVPKAGQGVAPGLAYGENHYYYGWSTSAAWNGTCKRFSLKLNDGTPFVYSADFQFIP